MMNVGQRTTRCAIRNTWQRVSEKYNTTNGQPDETPSTTYKYIYNDKSTHMIMFHVRNRDENNKSNRSYYVNRW